MIQSLGFLPFVALVTTIVGSLWLIRFGVRGRRLDMHPICRRCGFDLIGLPPGVRVCTECGSDLNRRGATRLGNRAKRSWAIALGLLPLISCVVLVGGWTWMYFRAVDPMTVKPVWWLRWEARSARSPSQPPVHIAYQVFLRGEEHEVPIAEFYCDAMDSRIIIESARDPGLKRSADVILRPSVAAAMQSVVAEDIWPGEIVLSDVRILDE